MIQQVTPESIQKIFYKLQEQKPDQTRESLKRILDLINLQAVKGIMDEDALFNLRLKAWRLVISADYESHERIRLAG